MIIVCGLKEKVLLPMRRQEWYRDRYRFRLTAYLDDGAIRWRGWFDDRDDADAFLWAMVTGSLQYERELWRLPDPWWDDAFLGLRYEFLTGVYLDVASSSNRTYNVPTDWNNLDNTSHGIGGGGGGSPAVTGSCGIGGGGGAYAIKANVTLTPGGTATYRVGLRGTQATSGGSTWFNGTTLAGSSMGAEGGFGKTVIVGGGDTISGGRAAQSVGDTKFSGGGSVTTQVGYGGSGGGGAAGPNGAGKDGGNGNNLASHVGGAGGGGAGGGSSTAGAVPTATRGGKGGNAQDGTVGPTNTTNSNGTNGTNGSGASGGARVLSGQPFRGGVGGAGIEWDAIHGAGGGGGGGGGDASITFVGGDGGDAGLYGGGGGGGGYAEQTTGMGLGSLGAQGLIFLLYNPVVVSGKGLQFNMPMLGM